MSTVIAGQFPKEFYLASAAAIPVLWLTVGFATSAITTLIHMLRAADATTQLHVAVPRPVARVLPSRPVEFAGSRIRAEEERLVVDLGVRGASGVLTACFILGLILAGIVGEVVSLIALFNQHDDAFMIGIVFTCLCVLVVLSGVVLLVSLAAATRAATGPRPERPPADVSG
jgi:hypothetical protein